MFFSGYSLNLKAALSSASTMDWGHVQQAIFCLLKLVGAFYLLVEVARFTTNILFNLILSTLIPYRNRVYGTASLKMDWHSHPFSLIGRLLVSF